MTRWRAAAACLCAHGMVLAAPAGLLAPGCAAHGRRVPAAAAANLPPPATPLDALVLAAVRAAHFGGLSAVLTLRGSAMPGGVTATADVWAGRPAFVYVGVRSFFGPPMDELVTDGVRYRHSSMRPGAGSSGPVTASVLGGMLPVALPPDQWVGALSGLPLPSQAPLAAAACGGAKVVAHATCVRVSYPDQDIRMWVDGAGVAQRVELRGVHLPVDLRYTKVRVVDGVPLPTVLEVTSPQQPGQQLTLTLSHIRANPPVPYALLQPLAQGP